jgi:hypothetical protein
VRAIPLKLQIQNLRTVERKEKSISSKRKPECLMFEKDYAFSLLTERVGHDFSVAMIN